MLTPAKTQERLDFLDVARGCAALLVLLEHGLYQCFPAYLKFSLANLVTGQAGILVFFMISGFVVPMGLENGGSTAGFWLRRAFRLLPVYWLSIGLGFVYLAAGGPVPLALKLSDTSGWLANLFLLQRCLGHPDLWVVFWSLHFELALYATCSVLFACGLLGRGSPWVGCSTGACGCQRRLPRWWRRGGLPDCRLFRQGAGIYAPGFTTASETAPSRRGP